MRRIVGGEERHQTGDRIGAAEAVEALFESHALDYKEWLQVPIPGDKPDSIPFVVNASKLTDALGYSPQLEFPQLVEEIAGTFRRL